MLLIFPFTINADTETSSHVPIESELIQRNYSNRLLIAMIHTRNVLEYVNNNILPYYSLAKTFIAECGDFDRKLKMQQRLALPKYHNVTYICGFYWEHSHCGH